jgi:nucleoside-diphosphate-sugar epimerase
LFKGIDAVIHLAAIPSPAHAVSFAPFPLKVRLTVKPNHVIFHTNIRQTYNVLEAARVCGIKSVALASSETVFGLPLYPHKPNKLPVTEEVERPESSYSLSKLMGEKMSEQYCRWDPDLKIINIRLSNVMLPGDYARFVKFQDDPASRAWK